MINRNKDSGVTLIVLVITIIVLLILAGVTIAEIFSDDGLWDKSNELAENTNSTLEENSEQVNNMVDELDDIINPWVQDKTVVSKKTKNGTIKKDVGKDYEYDCGVEGYTGSWKVLGAERGKLLIMSTVNVGTLGLKGMNGDGTTSYPAGYNNGIAKLNEMCKPYGENARSIKVEDINRVTGYMPEHKTISITSENKYYYDNDTANQSSTVSNAYVGTYGLATALGITNGDPATENAFYLYYPNTLTTTKSGTTVGIETTSEAYNLLFKKTDSSAGLGYWLASSCVYAGRDSAILSMRQVFYSDGDVRAIGLYNTDFGIDNAIYGVRAVVPVD